MWWFWLIVNLTESRIQWEMDFWPWTCSIIIITLVEIGRPTHSMSGILDCINRERELKINTHLLLYVQNGEIVWPAALSTDLLPPHHDILEQCAVTFHLLLSFFCQNIVLQQHGKKPRKWYQKWVCCCDKSENEDLSHFCESWKRQKFWEKQGKWRPSSWYF